MVSTVQYHNTPQAPRPATVIPAHIQPTQKRAYIPYPTFLLHGGGSEPSTSHDDDLPWILISTSASEAPRPSAHPKPRQHVRLPAPPPPQTQRPHPGGPMRYCSQTFHEHRRLSRKPMSADLHSLYSLHSEDGGGGGGLHRADSLSGASRTSSGGCSRSDSNSSSRTASSCYSNESVAGSSRSGSSIDSLPSQQGRRREWRNSLPLEQGQEREYSDSLPSQHGHRREYSSSLPQQGYRHEWRDQLPPHQRQRQMRQQSDPMHDTLVRTHSSEMKGSFFARRAASRMVGESPPPTPPERNIARGATYMQTPPEMSPRGILRFASSSQRPSRKRVSFKREPELEESMGLQERSSSEWEVLDGPLWAM